MDERAKYSKQQMPEAGSAEALQVATYPYRELIGTLLWISNDTKPDIVYVVNTLAKFTCNPEIVHWRAALRVLGYLNCTKHYYIRYAQQPFPDSVVTGGYMRGWLPPTADLNCYVDAGHAADVDTRRSTTGYIFFMSGGPISGQSRADSILQSHYRVWKLRTWQQVQLLRRPCGKLGYLYSLACVLNYQTQKFAGEAQTHGITELVYLPTAEQNSWLTA